MASKNKLSVSHIMEKFMVIYEEAEKNGLDSKNFIYPSLKNRDNINNNNKCKKSKFKNKFFLVMFILVIFLFLMILFSLIFFYNSKIFSFLLLPDNIFNNSCLIPVFSTFLLPPIDCSMCKNLKSIEKVSGMSKKTFEDLYAYTSKPIVITDATENWTASNVFSYEFFSELYLTSEYKLGDESNICQFFHYGTDFKNLSDFLSYGIKSNDRTIPWYVGWGNCDSDVSDGLRKHYSKPYFLPEESESSRMDWIFMGQPGFGSPLHLDKVGNPSWQAQIKGSKLWTLEPPSECYFECEPSIEVVLNPGEIIVLDTNVWFHGTVIIGDEISITIGSEYD